MNKDNAKLWNESIARHPELASLIARHEAAKRASKRADEMADRRNKEQIATVNKITRRKKFTKYEDYPEIAKGKQRLHSACEAVEKANHVEIDSKDAVVLAVHDVYEWLASEQPNRNKWYPVPTLRNTKLHKAVLEEFSEHYTPNWCLTFGQSPAYYDWPVYRVVDQRKAKKGEGICTIHIGKYECGRYSGSKDYPKYSWTLEATVPNFGWFCNNAEDGFMWCAEKPCFIKPQKVLVLVAHRKFDATFEEMVYYKGFLGKTFKEARKGARKAQLERINEKRIQMKQKLLEDEANRQFFARYVEPYCTADVTYGDSYDSGNCDTGTRRFAMQQGWQDRDTVTVKELYDAYLRTGEIRAKATIRSAVRRIKENVQCK